VALRYSVHLDVKTKSEGETLRNLFVAAVVLMFISAGSSQAGTVVYSNNFDSSGTGLTADANLSATVAGGVVATFGGQTSIVGVQGFSGLGPAGNQFEVNLAHSSAAEAPVQSGNPAQAMTLTLMNLPTHTAVDLSFLFAAIDSWDGTGNYYGSNWAPDDFNITVNGTSIFSQTFANVPTTMGGTYSDQGYSTAPLNPRGQDLFQVSGGFTDDRGYDSAYNMGLDSHFQSIADTSSMLTIKWFASGTGWQGGTDESWGLDNVSVALEGVPTAVPTPAAFPAGLIVMAGFGAYQFRQRRRKSA
jgi:hypothetical protein